MPSFRPFLCRRLLPLCTFVSNMTLNDKHLLVPIPQKSVTSVFI